VTSSQRVAGFDIGTNSLRVLVADVDDLSRFVSTLRLGFAVRLGEGLSSSGRVSEAALERTARVLGKSAQLARRLGASRMLAGATHVLRVASNANEAVAALEEAANMSIEILSPQEEAYYIYTGALSDGYQSGFVIDVGGGSTSLIRGVGAGGVESNTLPLGCVTLTEQFFEHDPPSLDEIRALCDHINAELARSDLSLMPDAENPVTGVGGAVTSIAAASLGLPHFESKRIDGHLLTRDEIENWAERLAGVPIEKRMEIAGLDRRRAQIAVAGAFILSRLTCRLDIKRLTVSTRGLRYGLALEAAAHPAG